VTGFLSGLGGKLAERWVSLLTLPGCVFIAVTWLAFAMGQSHATDREHLVRTVSGWYENAQDARPGTLGAIAVGVALSATLAGLAARVVARGVRRMWFGTWPGAAGGQMREVEDRIDKYYRVDLQLLWPRLWLVLSSPVRDELRTVITAVDTATVMGAWGVGYLALGCWWWPAAVGGAVVYGTGWVLARERTADMAALVETAVDIGLRPVARSLGITPPPAGSPEDLGLQLSPILHKVTAAPPTPRWRAPARPPAQNRRRASPPGAPPGS
jgi:hypothetical protein